MLSKKKYKTEFKRNFLIPVRDGVELAADLYLPVTTEKVPTIIMYYPYRKDDSLSPDVGARLRYFGERGYAGVLLDARGTGSSGGSTYFMNSAQEQQDGYDAIEYIADQNWCDGNIGITGVSYGGMTSLTVSTHAPPHLKASIPIFSAYDRYLSSSYPGGNMRVIMTGLYGSMMLASNSAPPYPDEKGRWLEVWNQHLKENEPWFFMYLQNQVQTGPWTENTLLNRIDKINASTFIFGGWHDVYPSTPFKIFDQIKSPKKMLIGPWTHGTPDIAMPGPRIDWMHESLRWFDYWLKDIDTGIVDEPELTFYARKYEPPSSVKDIEAGYWRSETKWPIERTKCINYYLNSNNKLESTPCVSKEVDTFENVPTTGWASGTWDPLALSWGLPLDQKYDEADSLIYSSEKLDSEIEVTGIPKLKIYFSSDQEISTIVTRLCDVSPDGTVNLVTKGLINCTHRNSHSKPEKLEKGKIYEIEIELDATSYVFDKDHQIRIYLSGSDFPNVWPSPFKSNINIYKSPDQKSSLILPVIPKADTEALIPDFIKLEDKLCFEDSPLKKYEITRDMLNNEITLNLDYESEREVTKGYTVYNFGDMTYTVSISDPSDAYLTVEWKYILDGPINLTEMTSICTIKSTQTEFNTNASLTVKENEIYKMSKNWTKKIPRNLV